MTLIQFDDDAIVWITEGPEGYLYVNLISPDIVKTVKMEKRGEDISASDILSRLVQYLRTEGLT